jgi:hypothetical protein
MVTRRALKRCLSLRMTKRPPFVRLAHGKSLRQRCDHHLAASRARRGGDPAPLRTAWMGPQP